MRSNFNTFTVFPRDWVVTAEQLMGLDPRMLLLAFLSVLNRLGLRRVRAFLVIAIHGEYDAATGLFHLHIHGLADQAAIAVLDLLRALPNFRCRRSLGEKQRVRIGRTPMTNLPYPLTYILQPYWPRRWRATVEGVQRRGKIRHRIPEPHHTMLLLWLDQWSAQDMMLMVGTSVGRSGLVQISASPRGEEVSS